MNEETNEVVSSVEDSSSTDLANVVESVEALITVIEEQNETKVEEEAKTDEEEETTVELLTEMKTMMEEQQPTEEEIEQQSLMVEEGQMTDESVLEQLTLLNENVSALIEVAEKMPKEEVLVESSYFLSLTVVISFAVYMFWNQLSKW